MTRNYILDKRTADLKLERMAYEIYESNLDAGSVIFVGIKENGSVIARKIQELFQRICDIPTSLIHLSLDKKNPGEVVLSEALSLDEQIVIIVDDVSNSGKTMLYALKPFLNSHPGKIQTLALVERTHKTFPINTDYVGLSVATTLQEHIYVEVHGETINGAYLE